MGFEEWLKSNPHRKYLDKTIKRYIRALEKAGEWLGVDFPKELLEINGYEEFISETNRIKSLPNYSEVNQSHGHGDMSAAIRLYAQFWEKQMKNHRIPGGIS